MATLDIKPQWLNVVRRLQSVARGRREGYSVLRITILVDSDGVPILWLPPDVVRFEPAKDALHFISKLMEEIK